jgi:hypothetical protein
MEGNFLRRKVPAISAIVALGVFAAGCKGSESSKDPEPQPHPSASTVTVDKGMVERANAASTSLEKLVKQICNQSFTDYYHGKIKPERFVKNSDPALNHINGNAMVTTYYPDEDQNGKISEDECSDQVVVHRFKTPEDLKKFRFGFNNEGQSTQLDIADGYGSQKNSSVTYSWVVIGTKDIVRGGVPSEDVTGQNFIGVPAIEGEDKSSLAGAKFDQADAQNVRTATTFAQDAYNGKA